MHSFAERVIHVPLDGRPPTEAAENLRKAKAARERLHKVAGSIKSAKSGGGTSSRVGVSGGASSQLLSSHNHAGATNPESLAAAFVSSFKAAAKTAAGGPGGRMPGGAPGPGAVWKRTVAISGRPSAAAAAGGPSASSSNSSNGDKSEGRKRIVTEMVQDAKEAAMDSSLHYIHARRHGCTKDVR